MWGAFCSIFLLLLLSGCGGAGKGLLSGALGSTGTVGKLVKGLGQNSDARMEVRTQVSMLVSKLSTIAIKRTHDFVHAANGAEEAARRFDQWLTSVTTELLNVSFKTAESMVGDARGDMQLSVRLQQTGVVVANMMRRSDFHLQPYDWFFHNCLRGPLWVEFLNYRALATVALLNVFEQHLDKMMLDPAKMKEYSNTLKRLNSSCPNQ